MRCRLEARQRRLRGAHFRSFKTDSVRVLPKLAFQTALPGSEPASASTQRDRWTWLGGSLKALQACDETAAAAGSEFPQFAN